MSVTVMMRLTLLDDDGGRADDGEIGGEKMGA